MLKIISVKIGLAVATIAAMVGPFVSTANAAVPAEASAALTAVQTDGGTLISEGWPVLAAITGALVLMKLFKKVVGKAT